MSRLSLQGRPYWVGVIVGIFCTALLVAAAKLWADREAIATFIGFMRTGFARGAA